MPLRPACCGALPLIGFWRQACDTGNSPDMNLKPATNPFIIRDQRMPEHSRTLSSAVPEFGGLGWCCGAVHAAHPRMLCRQERQRFENALEENVHIWFNIL